jgi:hypothetical protein
VSRLWPYLRRNGKETGHTGLDADVAIVAGGLMGKLQDKVAGKTKQIVAEVIGDGKLAEEGKEQTKKSEQEKPAKPLGNLDRLT